MEDIRRLIHQESAKAGLTISDVQGFGNRLQGHYPPPYMDQGEVGKKMEEIKKAVKKEFSGCNVHISPGHTNTRRKGATSNTVSKFIVERA